MATPHISTLDRRARLGLRHHLTPGTRASTVEDTARGVVALHATDPATVFLSIAARMAAPTVQSIEAALYERRSLVRMLGMRRTMFVVPVDLAPIVHSACTRAIAARERRRNAQLFSAAGFAEDIDAWIQGLDHATLAALARRGEATAQELGQDVPELRKQMRVAEGKNYEALQAISTRILLVLAAEGRIVRTRPRGSWISGQVGWTPVRRWLGGELAECPTPEAQTDLVRQWLVAFGPGTLADLKWWTGLTAGEVKRALEAVRVVNVSLDEGDTGLVLEDDLQPTGEVEPWLTLLPALDATPMGYTQRGWFLGPHAPKLFDRSGNIGPTIWADGRIVGGWAQRKNGPIAYKLLEDIGVEATRGVESAAHQLSTWLGAVRVTPRFRTPLERELSV